MATPAITIMFGESYPDYTIEDISKAKLYNILDILENELEESGLVEMHDALEADGYFPKSLADIDPVALHMDGTYGKGEMEVAELKPICACGHIVEAHRERQWECGRRGCLCEQAQVNVTMKEDLS